MLLTVLAVIVQRTASDLRCSFYSQTVSMILICIMKNKNIRILSLLIRSNKRHFIPSVVHLSYLVLRRGNLALLPTANCISSLHQLYFSVMGLMSRTAIRRFRFKLSNSSTDWRWIDVKSYIAAA
ncbi:unnamed protein product [Haemonchus placei]|uniref:Secreted protein n=1 Tax=Haemonchus placei TaxID=6290 RepID=A0A0N4WFV8_HAEPC|nr:unnamed protein product [Haemonchus placei]